MDPQPARSTSASPPRFAINLFARVYLAVENFILTRLVPLESPGRLFRVLFKIPLLLYKLGLSALVPKGILILTTVGCKSGKSRSTPVEFSYDLETGTYWVMAGWAGNTHWYKNALANPKVEIQIGPQRLAMIAEPMPDEEVAWLLKEILRVNPGSARFLSRWAGHPIDGSEASVRSAARFFPSPRLRRRQPPMVGPVS